MTRPRTFGHLATAFAALAFSLGDVSLFDVHADDDLAGELPRIKPLSVEDAGESFKIHAGFALETVATEPIVADPVSVCYDAGGRLYVVEMRGYPYPEKTPTGYVSLLTDADDDGRYEKKSVFVPDLSWPTSVVPYQDGVFIAVSPDILYAKDSNDDGVADVLKVMFTGFGVENAEKRFDQNVQGLFNSLLWGPDGWIYGVSGSNGGLIKNLSKPEAKPVSIRGRDFRFKPDGSAFEAISGGGQFGQSFDDWGHRFTCSNSNHIRQIVLPSHSLERNPSLLGLPVTADIAEEGPAAPVFRISAPEPWRVVRTRQRAADPVMARRLPANELVPIGFFTSATGVTIYRGDAYPAEFRGNAFIGDVGGNLVHRKVVSKAGAAYHARRADRDVEFLASTDNWFRPVNFTNTPDGNLLILDMYRETIEHPWSIPEPIKAHLDLTSGNTVGRLYKVVPSAGYHRRFPELDLAENDELVAALADPGSWWRETAQRLLIERNAQDAIPELKSLARLRPNPLARLHALWTLDVLGGLAIDDLLPAFKDPEANVREQAAKLAETKVVAGSALVDALLVLAGDPDPMVRFQAALSLGSLGPNEPRTLEALTAIALTDAADQWTRAAVLSSVPGRAAELMATLDQRRPGFFESPAGRPWIEDLALLVGAENKPGSVKAILTRFTRTGSDPDLTRGVLLSLGKGLQRAGGSLRDVLQGSDLGTVFLRAAEVATDGEKALSSRLGAIQLLSFGPIDQALDSLPDRLDPREPTAVQLAALQGLNALSDRKVGPLILSRWKTLSPAVRREAIEALFSRPERLEAVLDALVSKTLSPLDLDPPRQKQLLSHPDPSLRKRAEAVLDNVPQGDRAAVIAAFRPALAEPGDRARGKDVFKKACATCHRLEGEGIEVGPNLASVTGRSPDDLLVHILDPNREVSPTYLNYTLATTDGRVLTGLIADESANAVTLKRAEGATDVVPRARIEAVSSTGRSLMPEGLEKGLEPKDLADVISYLRGIPTPANK